MDQNNLVNNHNLKKEQLTHSKESMAESTVTILQLCQIGAWDNIPLRIRSLQSLEMVKIFLQLPSYEELMLLLFMDI